MDARPASAARVPSSRTAAASSARSRSNDEIGMRYRYHRWHETTPAFACTQARRRGRSELRNLAPLKRTPPLPPPPPPPPPPSPPFSPLPPLCAISGGSQPMIYARRLDGVGSLSELTLADALAVAERVDVQQALLMPGSLGARRRYRRGWRAPWCGSALRRLPKPRLSGSCEPVGTPGQPYSPHALSYAALRFAGPEPGRASGFEAPGVDIDLAGEQQAFPADVRVLVGRR